MGGPGSGRRPESFDGVVNKVKREVRQRVIEANREAHEPIDLNERNPGTEVVPGLQRKHFRQFLQLVRCIRNEYATEQAVKARKKALKRGRDGS